MDKGRGQNNKLCFADITDMIAGLEDFSPKDYEKVMAAVNKAKIELVDKLSKEDLEASNPEPKKVQKDASKTAPAKVTTNKAAEKTTPAKETAVPINPLPASNLEASDEPTAEELNSIVVNNDEPDAEDIIEEEVHLEDYQEDEPRKDYDNEEDDSFGYYSDDGIANTYSDDPIRMYLKEIGNFTLISSEDEVKLAKRINKGRAAVLIIKGENCPKDNKH